MILRLMSRIEMLEKIRKYRGRYSLNSARWLTVAMLLSFPAYFVGIICFGLAVASVFLAVPNWIFLVAGGIITWSACPALVRALKARSATLSPARVLTREESALLRPVLAEICERLRCRPPSRIEIDREENLSVYLGRGQLFRPRPVLRVGLPLMLAMTPEEFSAALAHECGHLLQYDDFWGQVIHRIQNGWIAGMDGDARGETSQWFWIQGFARWFWPELQARYCVYARLSEEHADRVSAGVFSGAGAAKARCLLISAYGSKLGENWMKGQLDELPEPSEWLVRSRQRSVSEAWKEDEARREFRALLASPDNLFASHPTLARMLEVMGESADLVPTRPPCPPEASAAQAFLGGHLPALEQELDILQRAEWENWWKDAHQQRKRAWADTHTAPAVSGPERAGALAGAWLYLGEPEQALPYLRAAREDLPEDGGMAAALAIAACKTDSQEAPQLVESVLREFPFHAGEPLENLIGYYARAGQSAEAQAALEQFFDYLDRLDDARKERDAFTDKEVLQGHQLALPKLAHLRAVLVQQGDVEEALLGRKSLKVFDTVPVHVLLIRYGGAAQGSAKLRRHRNQEIANLISPIVGENFVCDRNATPKLWKQLSAMANARLFAKE